MATTGEVDEGVLVLDGFRQFSDASRQTSRQQLIRPHTMIIKSMQGSDQKMRKDLDCWWRQPPINKIIAVDCSAPIVEATFSHFHASELECWITEGIAQRSLHREILTKLLGFINGCKRLQVSRSILARLDWGSDQ